MNRLMHGIRRIIARFLASVRFNRFNSRLIDQQEITWKQRGPMAWLPIILGNTYLRWTGSVSEVLLLKEWLRWESVMQNRSFDKGFGIPIDNDGSPTLRQILRSSDFSYKERQTAVEIALRSLVDLHRRIHHTADGREMRLSHGDATTSNVSVDLNSGEAHWFDFDIRHRLDVVPDLRHADDYRALLFSAIHELHPADYATFVRQTVAIIRQESAFQSFLQELVTNWQKPSLFHLVQAPLSFSFYQEARDEFLRNSFGKI